MKYKISVDRTFSAAHALRGYKGRCENLHGHNWKVRVCLEGSRLDKIGMLVDFREVKALIDEQLETLDHRHLNEVAPFTTQNPTAERIASYIFTHIKAACAKRHKGIRVGEVTVWESDTSSATVRA